MGDRSRVRHVEADSRRGRRWRSLARGLYSADTSTIGGAP
jgi:hypothetical protein